MDRVDINAIGERLASLRMPDEAYVIVSFGAHGPSHDCPQGHIEVTARRQGDEATSAAIDLNNALRLVRAKLDRIDEARRAEAEKTRAKKAAEKVAS